MQKYTAVFVCCVLTACAKVKCLLVLVLMLMLMLMFFFFFFCCPISYPAAFFFWCAARHTSSFAQIPVEPYTRREFLRVVKRYARVEQVVNGEMKSAALSYVVY